MKDWENNFIQGEKPMIMRAVVFFFSKKSEEKKRISTCKSQRIIFHSLSKCTFYLYFHRTTNMHPNNLDEEVLISMYYAFITFFFCISCLVEAWSFYVFFLLFCFFFSEISNSNCNCYCDFIFMKIEQIFPSKFIVRRIFIYFYTIIPEWIKISSGYIIFSFIFRKISIMYTIISFIDPKIHEVCFSSKC